MKERRRRLDALSGWQKAILTVRSYNMAQPREWASAEQRALAGWHAVAALISVSLSLCMHQLRWSVLAGGNECRMPASLAKLPVRRHTLAIRLMSYHAVAELVGGCSVWSLRTFIHKLWVPFAGWEITDRCCETTECYWQNTSYAVIFAVVLWARLTEDEDDDDSDDGVWS